jgi:hypothetical protein
MNSTSSRPGERAPPPEAASDAADTVEAVDLADAAEAHAGPRVAGDVTGANMAGPDVAAPGEAGSADAAPDEADGLAAGPYGAARTGGARPSRPVASASGTASLVRIGRRLLGRRVH